MGPILQPGLHLAGTSICRNEFSRDRSENKHFIKKHMTQTIINEDLNTLLLYKQFQQVRKVLIPETLAILELELEKLTLN